MLKKRILASSMASVMALSSFSVVAFADKIDDVAKKNGETVTEEELQAYVESLADFVEVDVYDYGTRQAERIIAAYDHALVVLDDNKSDEKAYTAAYLMLKQLYEDKVQYNAAQLKKLVKDFKGTYDTMNILNETDDFTDYRYTEATWDAFSSAWDNADSFDGSDDIRGITDAYIDLEEAEDNLDELDIVKKSDFRRVFLQYQDIGENMKKYESWRQGSVAKTPKTGNFGNKKKLADSNVVLTYAQLIDIVYGNSNGTVYYTSSGKMKPYTPGSGEYWVGSAELHTSVDTLENLITEQYNKMTKAKGVLETSDPAVNAAYEAAQDAVDVFKSWKEDTNRSGSKASATKLLDTYHNRLVEWNRGDVIDAFIGTDHTKLEEDVPYTSAAMTIDGMSVKFTYDPKAKTLKADQPLNFEKSAETKFAVESWNNRMSRPTGIQAIFKKNAVTPSGSNTNQAVPKNHDILEYIDFLAPAVPNSELVDARNDALDAFKTVYDTVRNGASGDFELLDTTSSSHSVAAGTDAFAVADDLGSLFAKADKDKYKVVTVSKDVAAVMNAAAIPAGLESVEYKLLAFDKGVDPAVRAKVVAHNDAVKGIADAVTAYTGVKITDASGKNWTGADLKAELKKVWETEFNKADGSGKTTVGAALLESKPCTPTTTGGDGFTTPTGTFDTSDASGVDAVKSTTATDNVKLEDSWVSYLGLANADESKDYDFHKLILSTTANSDGSAKKYTADQIADHNTAVNKLKAVLKNLADYDTALGTAATGLTTAYGSSQKAALLVDPIQSKVLNTTVNKKVRDVVDADFADDNAGLLVKGVDDDSLTLTITDAGAIAKMMTSDSNAGTAPTSITLKKLTGSNSGGTHTAPAATQIKHNGAIDMLIAAYEDVKANPATTEDKADTLPASGDGAYVDSVQDALAIYNKYIKFVAKNEDDIAEATTIMLSSNDGEFLGGGLADGRAIGAITGTSTAEWNLVWRNLLYALEFKFPETTSSTANITQLRNEIKRAAELIDLTGDSSLFSGGSNPHGAVADARECAINWLKQYNSKRNPKPTDKFIWEGTTEYNLKQAIDEIKGANDDLDEWYKGFKYSYDEIRDMMYKAAKKVDSKEYGEDVKKALGDVAAALAILTPSDVYDTEDAESVNPAFAGDRTFQPANRLKTAKVNGKDQNGYEKELAKAITKLEEAMDAIDNPEKPEVSGDVTGDGNVDVEDVGAVIDAFFATLTDPSAAIDAKCDLNGDGTIDIEDVNKAVDLVFAALAQS